MLWVEEHGGGSVTGVSIWDAEHERLVEQIVDRLQEQFFPELSGAWGDARPRCPGHPHPCKVEMRKGRAWWRCPVSGAWIACVGSLFG